MIRAMHTRKFIASPLALVAPRGRRNLSSSGKLPETFVKGFHDEQLVQKMRYRKLGSRCVSKNGEPMNVSILSMGASAFGGVYGTETIEEDCVQLTHEAIKSGMNLVDCAAWYGHGKAEEVLGKALNGIPREAYYLNTKVCRYDPEVTQMFDWSYDRTLKAIDDALVRMDVDYIDCIQVHDPEFAPSIDTVITNVFPAFVEAKRQGKVRQIGATGYPLKVLKDQIEGAEAAGIEINTCLSYCHYTLHDSSLVSDLIPYLNEKGVGLINASPISMGLLSNRGPPVWHPAPAKLKDLAREASEFCVKNGVDIGRLCLQHSLREESIPTTLVSTRSLERMRANLRHCHELGQLSEKEEEVLKYLVNDLFGPHGNMDWVGVEVAKYWRKMDKAQTS